MHRSWRESIESDFRKTLSEHDNLVNALNQAIAAVESEGALGKANVAVARFRRAEPGFPALERAYSRLRPAIGSTVEPRSLLHVWDQENPIIIRCGFAGALWICSPAMAEAAGNHEIVCKSCLQSLRAGRVSTAAGTGENSS
jgi:hypothetical protein